MTPASSKLIPVTLLTGFLGSCKTTMLNHLVRQPELADTLVIINEFGEMALDHLLVAHSNVGREIVEGTFQALRQVLPQAREAAT